MKCTFADVLATCWLRAGYNKKSAIVHCFTRTTTLNTCWSWCHLYLPQASLHYNASEEGVDAASLLPGNGGDRGRFSRRLAGGFPFCLLLRCTNPQFSVGQQKVLVPFVAFVFFVGTSIPVVCDFVNFFGSMGRISLLCYGFASRGVHGGKGTFLSLHPEISLYVSFANSNSCAGAHHGP